MCLHFLFGWLSYSLAGASSDGMAGSSTGAISGSSSALATGTAVKVKANSKLNKSDLISSPHS